MMAEPKKESEENNASKMTSNNAPVDPYTHVMGLRAMQRLIDIGTPEQIEEFEGKLKDIGFKWSYHDNKPVPIDAPVNEKQKEYGKKLWEKKPQTLGMGEITDFINFKMKRKPEGRPDAIDYATARKYMWDALKQIVYNQTGLELKAKHIDDHTKKILQNICHWLIGSDAGEWNPNRSLYIYGALGVGKSSIAEAVHYVYAFFKHKTGWVDRYLSFQSMEQLFLEGMSMTTTELKTISRFSCGGWVLDDIKPEFYVIDFFGNELQLINRILHARHELWRLSGNQTIITSNTPWATFVHPEHLNDKRLADRIKQQYIPIEYIGLNKRRPAVILKHS